MMNAKTMKTLAVRDDLDEHLPMVDKITAFTGRLANGKCYDARIVSGGFGLPHVILYPVNSPIELGLMECEDSDEYQQDGTDPIQVMGWSYRIDAQDAMLSELWSDELYHTADEAYEAARASICEPTP